MKDGGPVFPQRIAISSGQDNYVSASAAEGMSLRDYFAAHAMQALLSIPESGGEVLMVAAASYEYADGMLAARDSQKQS